MTRIVFMGTPEFAVPSLNAMVTLPDTDVVCVISQPDRPAGRGRALRASAVKARALELDLPVWTPDTLKGEAAAERLRAFQPDLFIVVAYGEILRRSVLDIPPRGAINVHGSLLPHHRGAAPVAGALLAGDAVTGVTIMLMDEGMDTGPILTTRAVAIRPDHTALSLSHELSEVGAALLAETVPLWLAGQIEPAAQEHALATKTRLIRKVDGRMDWGRPARHLANQVRAFDPWPGSFTMWDGRQLKILEAVVASSSGPSIGTAPGTVVQDGEQIIVATGDGWLELRRVQREGKTGTPIIDFVRGQPSFIGSVLGEEDTE